MDIKKELELIKRENELLIKQNDDFELIEKVTGISGFIFGLAVGIIVGFLF